LFSDLLVMALKCDLTRFGSFQLFNGGNQATITSFVQTEPYNLPDKYRLVNTRTGHHAISHLTDDNGFADLTAIVRYTVQQFAYLVHALKTATDASGSLLDHSVVMCSSEIGEGHSHSEDNLPVILAGRAGGLNPGRHVMVSRPMDDLYLSMLESVGYDMSRVANFTTATGGYGSGAIAELFA
jgi:hypothetical protein